METGRWTIWRTLTESGRRRTFETQVELPFLKVASEMRALFAGAEVRDVNDYRRYTNKDTSI